MRPLSRPAAGIATAAIAIGMLAPVPTMACSRPFEPSIEALGPGQLVIIGTTGDGVGRGRLFHVERWFNGGQPMTPPTLGDDRGLHTLTAYHRAVVATAVGLALSLSLVACSQISEPVAPGERMSCSLWQSHGNLVAENGRPVFRSIQHDLPPNPVPLDVPDGWEIRATDGGQFEVLDGTGTVLVTTGTRVIVLSDADQNTPLLNADGALVVCRIDPFPMDLEVEEAP